MRYTAAPARRAELVRRLTEDGYLASGPLAAELGVSEMTVRRDMRRLALEGLARRVAGGISRPPGAGLPFEERDRAREPEKRAVARAAVPLLAGAGTVALDAGTTVAPLVPLLAPGTTVVSHSVPVISACADRGDLRLIGIGGDYQPDTRSFAGPGARAALSGLSVDVAVLSATAVDPSGLLCTNPLDVDVKRALAGVARRTLLLVDHSKLAARAPLRVGPLSLLDALVTDGAGDPAAVAGLRAAGCEVLLADPDEA